MAKKKAAKKTAKKSTGSSAKKAPAKKSAPRKAAAKKKTVVKKAASSRKSGAASKSATGASAASRSTRKVVKKKPVAKAETTRQAEKTEAAPATRKKGVRKATLSSGIRQTAKEKKLGRSRIPIDAPLDVVFQNDMQAREAFVFLGIHTVRELEQFNPDELVMRLTSPAKQTVGRIRKILAMNNRSLTGDDAFALEFQERLSTSQAMNTH